MDSKWDKYSTSKWPKIPHSICTVTIQQQNSISLADNETTFHAPSVRCTSQFQKLGLVLSLLVEVFMAARQHKICSEV